MILIALGIYNNYSLLLRGLFSNPHYIKHPLYSLELSESYAFRMRFLVLSSDYSFIFKFYFLLYNKLIVSTLYQEMNLYLVGCGRMAYVSHLLRYITLLFSGLVIRLKLQSYI